LISERHVFRAVLLSVVLLLGIGPDIPLLCKALCDPAAAAANGCNHQMNLSDASARLIGGHDCDANVLIDRAYVREDGRRTAPSPRTGFAFPLAHSQLAAPVNSALPHRGPGHLSSLERRPLESALRI
jgi:hypothetical protein